MVQNPSLETSLIAIFPAVLMMLFILVATDLANTQDGTSSTDEDLVFIDFFRP